jgi:hypothetical protein
MERVCSKPEWLVITVLYQYWYNIHCPPSRAVIEDLVVAKPQNAASIDVLKAYDRFAEDLEVLAVGDLDVPLGTRVTDWEKWRITNTLSTANAITLGSYQSPNKGKDRVVLSGPRDAMNFLIGRFQEGILINDVPMRGGELTKTVPDIYARLEATEADRLAKKLFIKTGIPLIDNHLGGLRRKELNGVLAYTGQRKTYTCRRIAYNAASEGFRVLHIPMESGYDEEETIYSVFAASEIVERSCHITKEKLDHGITTPEEKKWSRETALSYYKKRVAPNLVVFEPSQGHTWGEVKSIIERENFKQKLDLVVIDYITMLYTPGARDDSADKMQIIQDLKMMAMTMNNGEGVSVLTPIQGNRNGFGEASEHEGQWELTGNYKYSEIEKSLDNCFYIWFNDEMNKSNIMRMGTCKSRRTSLIRPTDVPIDSVSGLVGSNSNELPQASTNTEVSIPSSTSFGVLGDTTKLHMMEGEED